MYIQKTAICRKGIKQNKECKFSARSFIFSVLFAFFFLMLIALYAYEALLFLLNFYFDNTIVGGGEICFFHSIIPHVHSIWLVQ